VSSTRCGSSRDIYEQDLSRVAVGAKVTVKALAYADKTFEGTVDWVSAHSTRDPHRASPLRVRQSRSAAQAGDVRERRIAAVQHGARWHFRAVRSCTSESRPSCTPSLRPVRREVGFELLPVSVDDTIEGAFIPVEHGLEPGANVVTHGVQALSTTM